MKRNTLTFALATTALVATGAFAQDATLTIESWRNDDLKLWQTEIIPAFEAKHPGIKVNFTPSAPAEYNAVLNSKLDAGSAGDLITCRPFLASLVLDQALILSPSLFHFFLFSFLFENCESRGVGSASQLLYIYG